MTAVRAFWWRPMTGPPAQALLDGWHFRRRPRVRGRRYDWHLRNFGDELTGHLVRQVAPDADVRHTDLPQANFVAVGSVLERVLSVGSTGLTVAGPGFIEPGPSVDRPPRWPVHLVRGHLSRERLGLPPDFPVGDPALALATRSRSTVVDSGPLVVLHYRVMRAPDAERRIRSAEDRLGARAIFSSDPVEEVLQAVARSSVVFSTSLHGVVVADALGRPSLPVSLGPTRNDYRFDDYHSALGVQSSPLRQVDSLDARVALDLADERADALGDQPAVVGARVESALAGAVESVLTAC